MRISQILQENTRVGVFFNNIAGLKVCNFVKKRLRHSCFLVKFAKYLRTPPAPASVFCSGGCVIIVSVNNITCISNKCIKVNLWSTVWCCIYWKIMPELINGSSKNMLADAFFELFCFCFMSNKYYWTPLRFRRYLFSVNTFFLLMRNARNETYIRR